MKNSDILSLIPKGFIVMKKDVLSAELRKVRHQGYQDGVNFAIDNYSAGILLCLKDKFDFTTEQLQEITLYINDMFDSICRDYLTLGDIMETLKEENGIDLRFREEVSNA